MKKFMNKYRIPSTRLQKWDYGWNASYFVTICTWHRICFFGRIESAIMNLSDIGSMAEKFWIEIPNHFPFVQLSDFVVMPNHVHGIITINKFRDADTVETQNFASLHQKQKQTESQTTDQNPNQNQQPGSVKNHFGPQSMNLASIIRGYKIGVSKYARIENPFFKWQSRYYDHIVHDQEELNRICNYILNNPSKWKNDEFYK